MTDDIAVAYQGDLRSTEEPKKAWEFSLRKEWSVQHEEVSKIPLYHARLEAGCHQEDGVEYLYT